jgi:trimeric autotransporter adhesin
MPSLRLARAGRDSRRVLAATVLTLCAALTLVFASSASAVTHKQAAKKALAALKSKKSGGDVIVFGLPKPVSKGTAVTQAGSSKVLARAGSERAFFFYEDSGPDQLYPHDGQVALVGAKTGKVKVTKVMTRAPLLNGDLPVFLRSSKAYRSSKYRVFYKKNSRNDRPPEEPPPPPPPFVPEAPDLEDLDGNKHPKAHHQTVVVKQGFSKNITLTGHDDDGDLLLFEITNQPSHGTLSGQPPEVTYTPDPGYLGNDLFAFKTSDDKSHSNTGNVHIDVVPLGQPPSVATSAGCTSYAERGPAVAVDPALAVSDPDDTVLDSATVRVTEASFVRGDDLVFTDQNGISGSYDDITGVLTLRGNATVAAYEAALRSVGYRNLGGGDPAPTKDIEFTVNDAGNDSAPAVKQVCITHSGPNRRPIGETSEGGLNYVENDGPLPVDGAFVVQDTDSANLSGAVIKFVASQGSEEEELPPGDPGSSTNGFDPAQDELAFADQNGISGSYDDVNGVMTLSGTASVADYETAIRSVTYENVSEDPTDTPRSLRFEVTDSSGATSIPSARGVLVTPVNDAPVVTTSAGSASAVGENPATVIDAGLTTLDVDDDDLEGATVKITGGFESGDDLVFVDQLGISGTYNTGTGVLTLTGTASVADYQTALRSVEFRNPGNPGGSRTIEFAVNDGDLDSGPATKGIEVNDKPVLDTTDAALSYTENAGPVAVDDAITATDADSASLAGATVKITGGFVEAEDELAFADQNGIAGSYDDTTGTLTLNGSASVADYQAALRSVTYENSSDSPSTATRTVSFQADDGGSTGSLSDAVTRDVTVTAVNDAPVVTASSGATSYTEGDPATAVDSALTVADVDDASLEGGAVRIASGFEPADELVFTDQNGIAGVYDSETGVLTLTGTASVADYETALRSVEFRNGGDNPAASRTVEFTVSDGELDSAAAAKEIAITGVNDKPVLDASDAALTYSAGSGAVAADDGIVAVDVDSATFAGATVQITGNFTEAEDELAFADQNGIAGSYDDTTGTLTLSGSASVADYETALRSVTYENSSGTPSTATRTVTFQVDDGADASDPVTRDIEIDPGNDAPVVTTSSGATSYTAGDGQGVPVDGAVTVSDSDDANIEAATVKITGGFESGDDLVFIDQLGISGVYNTGTGVLTLVGTASLASYEAALRSVVFRHTGANPSASRTVEFQVNDGDVDSNAASKSIDIAPAPAE